VGYTRHRNITCVYVYFDYKDQKSQDLISLLSSLLAQLLRSRDQISQETKDIHDDLQRRGMSPSLDEYLLVLESQIKVFDKVFIIVDALDECADDTRKSFLKALHQLPRRAHILFTSRPVVSIGKQIKAERQVNIVANKDDLRKYLEHRINTFDHLMHLVDKEVQKDSSFLDNILHTIVEKSQGMQVLAC
jgi:hypothetical protein